MKRFVNHEKFGRRLKKVRQEREVSREQLASELGCSVDHIKNVENANVGFGFDALVGTANFLNISLDCLAGDSLKNAKEIRLLEYQNELTDIDEEVLESAIGLLKKIKNSEGV